MSKIFADLASLENILGYENLSRILNTVDEITDKFNAEVNKNPNINKDFEKLDRFQITMINFLLFIAKKQKNENARKVFAKIAYSFYLDYILSTYKIIYDNKVKIGGKKQKGGTKITVFRNEKPIKIDTSQLQKGDIPAIKVIGLDGFVRYVPADDSDSDDEIAFSNGWAHGNAALVVGEDALENIQNGLPPVQPQQSMIQYDEDEGSVLEFNASQYNQPEPITEQPDIMPFLSPEEREEMQRQMVDFYKRQVAIAEKNQELQQKQQQIQLEMLENETEIMRASTASRLEAEKEKMRLLKGLPSCGTCLECASWGIGGGVTTSVSVWALKQLGYLTVVKPVKDILSAATSAATSAAETTYNTSETLQEGVKLGSNIAATLDSGVGNTLWGVNKLFEAGSLLAWGSKKGLTNVYNSAGQLYNYVTTDQTSSNLRKVIEDVADNVAQKGNSTAQTINFDDYVVGVVRGSRQLYDLTTGELLWMDANHTMPATADNAGILDAAEFEWGNLSDLDNGFQPRNIEDLPSDCHSWMTANLSTMWNTLEQSFPSYTDTLETARPYIESPEFVCGFAGCCIMSSLYVARESMWRKSVAAAIATEGRSDPASNTLATSMAKTTEFIASSSGQTALNIGAGAASICFPAAAAGLTTLRAITGTVGPKNKNIQGSLGINKPSNVQQIRDSSRLQNVPESMMLTNSQQNGLRQRRQGLITDKPYIEERSVKGPPAPGWTMGVDGNWRPPPPPRRGGKSIRKNIRRRTHKKRVIKKRKVTTKTRKVTRTRKNRK